jgi:hypothetical protein
VLLAAVVFGAAQMRPAAQRMVVVTLAAIALYDGLGKRWTPSAMVLMAACRVGNVLIGWSTAAGAIGMEHGWRFDLSERAAYGWALVGAVAALTATASLVSGLEKRRGRKRLFGLDPSRIVLACLVLMPVAGSACVGIAWSGSPWALGWLSAAPLIVGSSALARRLRGRPIQKPPGDPAA